MYKATCLATYRRIIPPDLVIQQVRASPLETFVALMGAPKNSQTAVVSGTLTVQSLDDHSDVVRLCLRPAWLKVAWASPRDFCLARCVFPAFSKACRLRIP